MTYETYRAICHTCAPNTTRHWEQEAERDAWAAEHVAERPGHEVETIDPV